MYMIHVYESNHDSHFLDIYQPIYCYFLSSLFYSLDFPDFSCSALSTNAFRLV